MIVGIDSKGRAVFNGDEDRGEKPDLRDQLAMSALPWTLSLHHGKDWGHNGDGHLNISASKAYRVADAMLAARSQEPSK